MDVQVAVVGGGVMGLATGHALREMGVEHVVLERFEVGHGNGSSHGETRIFRYLYDDPLYVRMAQATLPLWQKLGVLEMTGGLQIDTPDVLERHADAMRACGASTEMVPRDRFDWIDPDGSSVMYVPDLGIISAADALRAFTCTVQENTTVDAIEGSVLHTSSGTVRTEAIVVAAGAWVTDFIELPVRVTREQVLYFAGDTSGMIPWVHGVGHWIYAIPRDGRVKVGEHGTGATTTASERSFEPDEAGAERVCAYVRKHVPHLDPEPVGFETCLYTNTKDDDFIIDRQGPVVVLSPCSGHGFKFAPLIGKMAACLALRVEPPMSRELDERLRCKTTWRLR